MPQDAEADVHVADPIAADMSHIDEQLGDELDRQFSQEQQGREIVPAVAHPVATQRLPRRIPGGFDGVTEDLGRHARASRRLLAQVDHRRSHVQFAVAEHERIGAELDRAFYKAKDGDKTLKTMLEAVRLGDGSGDVAAQFEKAAENFAVVEDQLQSMVANLELLRGTWEGYVQTMCQANRLRDEAARRG